MESKKEAFREWLIENERSENTINAYMYAVDQFFEMFTEVTKKNMIAYKRKKMSESSPATAANRCIAMNQFCEFIGKRECKVKGIKIHKQTAIENVPTLDEYRYMLKCLKRENEKAYWIIRFLAQTGARASELIRFEKEHLEKREVVLWTKGKIRKILIPENLAIESDEHFKKQTETKYLFPNRYGKMMTTRGLDSIIKSCKKYGVREEILHAHAFRHLFAIQFLKHNKNIALLADLMGHESVDTTAIYLKLSAEEQRNQLNEAMGW